MQLEHPHTVDAPADGAVGVEVEGHQVFWTCDTKPSILVLTTVPPHTDSLGVSTKTKAGLVTEDDPLQSLATLTSRGCIMGNIVWGLPGEPGSMQSAYSKFYRSSCVQQLEEEPLPVPAELRPCAQCQLHKDVDWRNCCGLHRDLTPSTPLNTYGLNWITENSNQCLNSHRFPETSSKAWPSQKSGGSSMFVPMALEWDVQQHIQWPVSGSTRGGVSNKVASERKHKGGVSNKVASEWKRKVGVSNKVASERKHKVGVSNKVASERKHKVGVSNKVASERKHKVGVSNKVASERKHKVGVSNKVASERKHKVGVSNKVASERKHKVGVSNKVASERKHKGGVSNKVASERKHKVGVSNKVASERKHKGGVSNKVASERKHKAGVSNKVASERKHKVGVSNKVASEQKHKRGVSNKVASERKHKGGCF
ncbi:hypothetical protein NFI96_001059 [Prochilodus magdalenae]|nr:hypothetical protein NFI96_001059 [Prochilodus magdalenae]